MIERDRIAQLYCQGRSRSEIAVDRRSRFTILSKVKSKNSRHVHHKIKARLKGLKAHRRRSVTLDNGTEFARCSLLERHLQMKAYYADVAVHCMRAQVRAVKPIGFGLAESFTLGT